MTKLTPIPPSIRNYHDFHKVGPEELERVKQLMKKAQDWNIYTKPKKEDKDGYFSFTNSFSSFMDAYTEVTYPHVDPFTGYSKKPEDMSRAEYRSFQRRHKDREILERQWNKSKGVPGYALADQFEDHFGIMTTLHLVLAYRVTDEYFQVEGKDMDQAEVEIQREITRKDGTKERIYKPQSGPTWDKIGKLLDKKLDTMSAEEYDITIGVAKSIYGLTKMRYETEIDKLLLGKMVDLEIITDTGHLTTVFKDILLKTAKEDNITFEELARKKYTLFAVVVEFTRQEDYNDPREYLGKKTDYERQEYTEMARVVNRYILADTIKTNEKLENEKN